jgi:hypothetical protein
VLSLLNRPLVNRVINHFVTLNLTANVTFDLENTVLISDMLMIACTVGTEKPIDLL